MKTKVLFPGSFDPFTLGHMEIIRRLISDYDKVVIVVGNNTDKEKVLFTSQERVEIIKKELDDEAYDVEVYEHSGKIVDFAIQHGITHIARGYRSKDEFEREKRYEFENNRLLKSRFYEVEHVFIKSSQAMEFVSSSAFKRMCEAGEYIAAFDYVSPRVHCLAMEKYLLQKDLMLTIGWLCRPTYGEPWEGILDFRWKEFLPAYSYCKGRSWHNFSHLAMCINYANNFIRETGSKVNKSQLIAVIFYHDIVSNKQEAAMALGETMQYYRWDERQDTIEALLATQHLDLLDVPGENLSAIGALMSDIDIAHLADEKLFRISFEALALEGIDNDNEVVIENLEKFYNAKHLFKTEYFKKLCEAKAKENLGNILENIS